jgi:hypothetical protein
MWRIGRSMSELNTNLIEEIAGDAWSWRVLIASSAISR